MKDSKELVSVYARYINSLKADGADIKNYCDKMTEYINAHCEEWIKLHLLQDCLTNSFRALHNKIDAIAPSILLGELIDTNCSEEAVKHCKTQLEAHPLEWGLPTFYKYFNPENEEELDYMFKELEIFKATRLITDSNYQAVLDLVLKPSASRFTRENLLLEKQKKQRQQALLETQKDIVRESQRKQKLEESFEES